MKSPKFTIGGLLVLTLFMAAMCVGPLPWA